MERMEVGHLARRALVDFLAGIVVVGFVLWVAADGGHAMPLQAAKGVGSAVVSKADTPRDKPMLVPGRAGTGEAGFSALPPGGAYARASIPDTRTIVFAVLFGAMCALTFGLWRVLRRDLAAKRRHSSHGNG